MKHVMMIGALFVFLLVFNAPALAQMSFAILPMEVKGEVSTDLRESAENALYQYLIDSGKYKIIERSRLEDILKEQSFQMTGAADQTNAVELGKILGVEKLLASTLYMKESQQPAIRFSVIDIATAEVEFSKEFSFVNYTVDSLARLCAAYVLIEYPLLGEVLGKSQDIFVTGLGEKHGRKVGDRLFVARKDVLVDDETQEVLFQEISRIGTLRVQKLNATRSQTSILALEDPQDSVQKGDLVSPEPVPKRDPMISTEPLLGNIVKGDLLLDDDMERRKYLVPTYNQGEDYIDGKLHLNATQLTAGQVYCYYPTPFDRLENFVIEGAVEFQPVEGKYNKVSVVLRSNGEYSRSNNYTFYWHDEGGFAVYQWRLANPFELVPLQPSPAIRRGDNAVNIFRIVAYGAKFDCYLNDEFIIGFEDETLEKGQIGFMVEAYGYATVDDVKIWNAVKK